MGLPDWSGIVLHHSSHPQEALCSIFSNRPSSLSNLSQASLEKARAEMMRAQAGNRPSSFREHVEAREREFKHKEYSMSFRTSPGDLSNRYLPDYLTDPSTRGIDVGSKTKQEDLTLCSENLWK